MSEERVSMKTALGTSRDGPAILDQLQGIIRDAETCTQFMKETPAVQAVIPGCNLFRIAKEPDPKFQGGCHPRFIW